MGYRSEVTAVFYVREAKHFPILKLWLTSNFPMSEFSDSVRWFDRGMVLNEKDVKWYEDYELVKAFDAAKRAYILLVHNSKVEEGSPWFCYEFVRIGENYDDVETEYDGIDCEWLLGVTREITCEV